jgi:glucose dehydrogenase
VLADVEQDGTIVKLVFSSGKHGFVVAADRTSGIEVWRTPVGRHLNDTVAAFRTVGVNVRVHVPTTEW